ncbi:MAG TPA: hypothetical protein VFR23_24465 [Jiangellaceae bacterium]|nr:hypothetical protein [Jiangellaceae bacterium]
MSDNTSFTIMATLAAVCFGGFLFFADRGCAKEERQNLEHQTQVSKAQLACIESGRLWLDGNCLPKCAP